MSIRSGLNGPVMTEYDTEPSPTTVCIEAVTGTILCPQITIHKNFNWHEADGLFVAIRYGSKPYQLEFWVPKLNASSFDGEEDWSFQIPGKNVLDTATKQLVGYQYRFADLEVSEFQQMAAINPSILRCQRSLSLDKANIGRRLGRSINVTVVVFSKTSKEGCKELDIFCIPISNPRGSIADVMM